MEQKIYLVITHFSGDITDDEFTSVIGTFNTKEKALAKLWEELEKDKKLMAGIDYTLNKDEDSYTIINEDDDSFTENYIKEMEIE